MAGARVNAMRLAFFAMLAGLTTPFAHASTNTTLRDLETPLQTLQSSLPGPVALAIGVIAVAITGDVMRGHAPGYPDHGEFPDPLTTLIDAERRAQFTKEGSHFESDYYINLTYLPPFQKEEKLKGYVFSSPDKKGKGIAERVIAYFKSKAETFDAQLQTLLKARRLRAYTETDEFGEKFWFDEQLRYVRRAVQGLDYKFALPEIPIFLHEMIDGMDLLGGTEPMLGNKYMGVVAIDSFPSVSTPGFLLALDLFEV